MAGEIDVQRRYGGVPFRDGVEIGAGTGILAGPGIADPKDFTTAWIARAHDGLAPMAVAKTGHFDAAQLTVGQIGDVYVQDDRADIGALQALLAHASHQLRGDLGGAGEIARAV